MSSGVGLGGETMVWWDSLVSWAKSQLMKREQCAKLTKTAVGDVER